MPESEVAARLGQDAGGTRLVESMNQIGDPASKDGRQVRHGEVHAEQRRCLQDLAHLARDEAQAVGNGRRQGVWCGGARQLGRASVVDCEAAVTLKRRDQFRNVQRIASRAVGQPQQLVVGQTARQGRDQRCYRAFGQSAEPEVNHFRVGALERTQVIAPRHRPHRGDEHQRNLPH